jgi:hypothetical protein
VDEVRVRFNHNIPIEVAIAIAECALTGDANHHRFMGIWISFPMATMFQRWLTKISIWTLLRPRMSLHAPSTLIRCSHSHGNAPLRQQGIQTSPLSISVIR